jgi:hypothetical protein
MLAPRRKPKPAQFGVVPGTNVALLTDARKMPGYSWSIRAILACPGASFGPGAICGESKEHTACYATQGHYRRSNVVRAQLARYDWARRCTKTPEGRDWFVATMTGAILASYRKTGMVFFRVHDAGDLFNARYTECWERIADALPEVYFWFPTRSWRLSWAAALHPLASLPNVSVRPSALHFEEEAPSIVGLAAGTRASTTTWNCPSSLQDGECGDCRECWLAKQKVITYRSHGDRSRHTRKAIAA